jgi:hypothetical protein
MMWRTETCRRDAKPRTLGLRRGAVGQRTASDAPFAGYRSAFRLPSPCSRKAPFHQSAKALAEKTTVFSPRLAARPSLILETEKCMSTQTSLENTAATVVPLFEPDAAAARPVPPPLAVTSEAVLIHVRYYASAQIWEIAACPQDLTKEQWLERLMQMFGDRYQTRVGGRGFFKITRAELDAALSPHRH